MYGGCAYPLWSRTLRPNLFLRPITGEITRVTLTNTYGINTDKSISYWAYELGVANFNTSGAGRVSVVGLMFMVLFSTLK